MWSFSIQPKYKQKYFFLLSNIKMNEKKREFWRQKKPNKVISTKTKK